MGARIGKIITETMTDIGSEIEGNWDLERGESSDSWDSSTSSNCEETSGGSVCYEEEEQEDELEKFGGHPEDPYVVEKRFVAGSNSFTYDIIKRK